MPPPIGFTPNNPSLSRASKRPEARQLLEERLSTFYNRFSALPEECKPFFHDDRLFPLGALWFDHMEQGSIELRPRDVLTWASDRWREIQERIRAESGKSWLRTWKGEPTLSPPPVIIPPDALPLAIDAKVTAKIAEAVTNRRLQPGSLPADADNLQRLVTELLKYCVKQPEGYTLTRFEATKHAGHLIVHENGHDRAVRNHVQLIVTGSKTSAAAQLRRLLNCEHADYRILITDEERSPLQVGAAGQQHLDALQRLGTRAFQHVKLKFEDYALLDAMLSVAGEARSGDLEIEPQAGVVTPITEEQVIASYHRQDLFRKLEVLKLFLSEEPSPALVAPIYPPKASFREFVLAKLAFLMGANLIELTRGFIATNPVNAGALDACLPAAKEIVLEMHQEDLVCAKPWDNDLYLTIGIRA